MVSFILAVPLLDSMHAFKLNTCEQQYNIVFLEVQWCVLKSNPRIFIEKFMHFSGCNEQNPCS